MDTRYCLVVDDDPLAAIFIVDLLRTRGIAVDRADCIAAADRQLAAQRYHWLLVDRQLPDGDGLAWLSRRLESLAEPAAQRCLVSSGDCLSATLMPLGVTQLRKPIDVDRLLAWIDTTETSTVATVATLVGSEAAADLPLFDNGEALRRLGGRSESLLALRDLLRKELLAGSAWQAALGQAEASARSLAQLHRLRAACALTGCTRLARFSELLEGLLRAGQVPDATLLAGFYVGLNDTLAAL